MISRPSSPFPLRRPRCAEISASLLRTRTTPKALLLLTALLLVCTWWPGNAAAQRGQARSLVGVWQSQVQTPYGMSYGRTILMPDGTFTKTFRLGQMITWDTGKYTVGQNYIHFTIEDHEPKKYMGKKMHWVKSETIFFKFLGPNKISCEDRIVGTSWVAYRSR